MKPLLLSGMVAVLALGACGGSSTPLSEATYEDLPERVQAAIEVQCTDWARNELELIGDQVTTFEEAIADGMDSDYNVEKLAELQAQYAVAEAKAADVEACIADETDDTIRDAIGWGFLTVEEFTDAADSFYSN